MTVAQLRARVADLDREIEMLEFPEKAERALLGAQIAVPAKWLGSGGRRSAAIAERDALKDVVRVRAEDESFVEAFWSYGEVRAKIDVLQAPLSRLHAELKLSEPKVVEHLRMLIRLDGNQPLSKENQATLEAYRAYDALDRKLAPEFAPLWGLRDDLERQFPVLRELELT